MKLKLMFSTLILTFLVATCAAPASPQSSAPSASPTEKAQPAPSSVKSEPATPATNSLAVGGDERGYILFAPLRSTTTYLINFEGQVVQTWPSQYSPGNAVYLLESGNLLRTANLRNQTFNAGGAGGLVQELDWNGNVRWEFEYASDKYLLHHDVEQLPNGHILMIAWEMKTTAEATAAGRDPSLLQEGALWPDQLIEVDPTTNQIVWEWHIWDHLVQDFDSAKANYGQPSAHPELIDLNYMTNKTADWTHMNAVDYNPALDQILVSVHGFSEIWIIDHSTSTTEAAGHSGGKSGHGGDLLYRWGNSQAYGAGSAADQQLFSQHDAQWIAPGLPGAGNILVFNNGDRRTHPSSSVDELIPPLNADGSYALNGAVYGPAAPVWTYAANPAISFYASNISGAQRLPDGQTLICNGPSGSFFEVTPAGETLWTYVNPYGQSAPGKATAGPAGEESGNPVFRAVYYAPTYAGLAGRDLSVKTEAVSAPTVDEQNQSLPRAGQSAGPSAQRQPPEAALQACSGANQGAACTFSTPKGSVTGTCAAWQTQLACKPQGGPAGNP